MVTYTPGTVAEITTHDHKSEAQKSPRDRRDEAVGGKLPSRRQATNTICSDGNRYARAGAPWYWTPFVGTFAFLPANRIRIGAAMKIVLYVPEMQPMSIAYENP